MTRDGKDGKDSNGGNGGNGGPWWVRFAGSPAFGNVLLGMLLMALLPALGTWVYRQSQELPAQTEIMRNQQRLLDEIAQCERNQTNYCEEGRRVQNEFRDFARRASEEHRQCFADHQQIMAKLGRPGG